MEDRETVPVTERFKTHVGDTMKMNRWRIMYVLKARGNFRNSHPIAIIQANICHM